MTLWLASPHVQTTFLNFFGRAPRFSYRRYMLWKCGEVFFLFECDCFGRGLSYADWSICLDLLGKFFMRRMVERLPSIGF